MISYEICEGKYAFPFKEITSKVSEFASGGIQLTDATKVLFTGRQLDWTLEKLKSYRSSFELGRIEGEIGLRITQRHVRKVVVDETGTTVTVLCMSPFERESYDIIDKMLGDDNDVHRAIEKATSEVADLTYRFYTHAGRSGYKFKDITAMEEDTLKSIFMHTEGSGSDNYKITVGIDAKNRYYDIIIKMAMKHEPGVAILNCNNLNSLHRNRTFYYKDGYAYMRGMYICDNDEVNILKNITNAITLCMTELSGFTEAQAEAVRTRRKYLGI